MDIGKTTPKYKDIDWEYNPIKQPKDGTEAEKVIWTTKALNIAVDAIKKGLPLKANPFCGKNVQLLKPDLVYKRTKEEIDDYLKCREDPVYFASKCHSSGFLTAVNNCSFSSFHVLTQSCKVR